ncbi:hypothetical protein JKP88DRAFT_303600 [Tribonema minus]|uniref:Uncharacterized protein n=1 Tax=Tribonema minus TaxID=303371 RepID=A0A836CKN1_9STRA|nr:hypothetical protein JKP88DRAFT_303600 [Tribonema minus]
MVEEYEHRVITRRWCTRTSGIGSAKKARVSRAPAAAAAASSPGAAEGAGVEAVTALCAAMRKAGATIDEAARLRATLEQPAQPYDITRTDSTAWAELMAQLPRICVGRQCAEIFAVVGFDPLEAGVTMNPLGAHLHHFPKFDRVDTERCCTGFHMEALLNILHDSYNDMLITDLFPLVNGPRSGGIGSKDPSHMTVVAKVLERVFAGGARMLRVSSRTACEAALQTLERWTGAGGKHYDMKVLDSRTHVFTGVAVPGLPVDAPILAVVAASEHLPMLRMPWIAADIVKQELLFCALVNRPVTPAAAQQLYSYLGDHNLSAEEQQEVYSLWYSELPDADKEWVDAKLNVGNCTTMEAMRSLYGHRGANGCHKPGCACHWSDEYCICDDHAHLKNCVVAAKTRILEDGTSATYKEHDAALAGFEGEAARRAAAKKSDDSVLTAKTRILGDGTSATYKDHEAALAGLEGEPARRAAHKKTDDSVLSAKTRILGDGTSATYKDHEAALAGLEGEPARRAAHKKTADSRRSNTKWNNGAAVASEAEMRAVYQVASSYSPLSGIAITNEREMAGGGRSFLICTFGAAAASKTYKEFEQYLKRSNITLQRGSK